MSDKPLFIPLKREYYEAFKRGDKTKELRPYGPRWNSGTVWEGRPVILSLGYGKRERLHGKVIGQSVVEAQYCESPRSFFSIYGHDDKKLVIEIEIELEAK